MAEFITTNGASFHIENIIKTATSKLVLISPYLQISHNFLARLQDASRRGVKTTVIFKENKLSDDEMLSLAQIKNVFLFSCGRLHAKCYFNETTMVVTSMNMYEFSEKNNREMGILLKSDSDNGIFNEALDEAKSIVRDSSEVKLNGTSDKTANSNNRIQQVAINTQIRYYTPPEDGHCIRCGRFRYFNLWEPYCKDCYYIWREYGNRDYIEQYCHTCGSQASTTIDRPECYDCYSRRPRELSFL